MRGTLYALGLRVSRLNVDGTPMVGANNAFVTNGLVFLEHEDEIEAGDEITQKNGAAAVAYSYKAPDSLKRTNITLQLTSEIPEFDGILAGGVVLTSGGTPVGLASPKVGPLDYPVCIEGWTQNVEDGGLFAAFPYRRLVIPMARLRRNTRRYGADALAPEFQGYGVENTNLGNGPFNDWTFQSDRVWQYADENILPTWQTGYVAVPVQT